MILLAVGLLCSSIQQVINSNTVSAVAPTTTSIAATSGLISGGDTVTVTGSDFTKAVNFQTLTKKWSIVSAGYNHTCALDSNAKAYCWGQNNYGQLGNNSTTDSSTSVAVDTSGVLSGKTLVAIYSGGYHTCVLDSDGKVYCWGQNNYGQLGNNSTTDSSVPVAVNTSGVLSGKILTSITAGDNHTCVLDSTGKAYCWGYNGDGQLGNNSTTSSSIPVAVNTSGVLSGKTVTTIAAGSWHTCALDSTGKAYCWGYNGDGQLGRASNNTTNSSVPVAVYTSGVLSGKTVTAIAAGDNHTCVLDSTGKAYCWGQNNYGQLGNNSTTNSTVPVAVNTSGVLSGKVLTNISVGYAYTCVLDSDGKAYCWGLNEFGRLGDNTATQRNTPVAVYTSGVLSGKTLVAVSAGDAHGCVIDSNGEIYCWGNNTNGQLGGNSNTNSYVPVNTIIIVDNVTLVALGGSTCTNLAILSDTTLTCVTPAHAAGVVNVVLSSDDGLSTLTNAYTYYTTSSAPTITSASRASTTSVVLVWTAPSSNGYSTITDYAIQYKLSTDSTWVTFSDGVSTALTATVTGLAADSMYDFRVAAINAAGTGAYSAIVTVKGFYITVSSSETLSVGAAPGKFSSVQDTVAVDTNNAAGYSLSMQSASSNLTNSVSGSTIPTLTGYTYSSPASASTINSLIGSSSFWVYRVNGLGSFGSTTAQETNASSTAYSWATTPTTSTTIKTNSLPTDTGVASSPQNTVVWYGASATTSKSSGTYQATITYTAATL